MRRNKHLILIIIVQWAIGSFFPGVPSFAKESKYINIGSGRELFVDYYLIDRLDGTRLILHHPHDEGPVLKFDQPWEGPFCGYCTVINTCKTDWKWVADSGIMTTQKLRIRVKFWSAGEPRPSKTGRGECWFSFFKGY